MNTKKKNQDGSILRTLRSEAKVIASVVAISFSVIMFVVVPQMKTEKSIALIQQSIQTIESNHMTHIQGYAEEIAEIKKEQADLEQEQKEYEMKNSTEHIEILRSLERALTILELNNN